jgi:hypothetical protein
VIRTLLNLTLFVALGTGTAIATELTPPVADGAVQVTVLVYILDVNTIDSGQQTFTANVYLEYGWHDPRLKHGGEGPVIRGMNEIWQPKLQVLNQQRLWPTFPEQLEVFPDGTVRYSQRVWGNFTQPMDLHDYPMDSQKLTIQLVAVGMTPDQVELVPAAGVEHAFASDLSLADFEFTGSEMAAEPYQAIRSGRMSASILCNYFVSRKPGYYVVKVIIPLILIVMMSWAVFWIDPKMADPQIGIAATTMLTLIAFRFAIDANLPKIAYLTRLDTFIMASTVLVFLTLAQAVLTTGLASAGRLEQARRCDRWARLLFPSAFLAVVILAFVI